MSAQTLDGALLERYRHFAQDQRVTPVIALTLKQAS
jgi:hypothetical protein